MPDYTLYWEDEGVPHETTFESRGDLTAIKHIRQVIGRGYDQHWWISNVRLTRIVHEE